MNAAIPSEVNGPSYIARRFAPMQGLALLERGRAAVCAVAAVVAAGTIVHDVAVLVRSILMGHFDGDHASMLIRLVVAAVIFALSVRTGLDYLFFLKEGGYLRLLPQGVQFRDQWFRLRTVPWDQVARLPNSELIEIIGPDGQVRNLKPRVGYGVIEELPLLDVLGAYRPDLAIARTQEALDRLGHVPEVIDLRAASARTDTAPDSMVVEFRSASRPNLNKPGEVVRLSPEGLTIRIPFRWSKVRTLPWSVFTDLWVVEALPGLPEPCISLWRERERPDRMVVLLLEGVTDRVGLLAAIYRHRPDLDRIRRSESRMMAWQARLQESSRA